MFSNKMNSIKYRENKVLKVPSSYKPFLQKSRIQKNYLLRGWKSMDFKVRLRVCAYKNGYLVTKIMDRMKSTKKIPPCTMISNGRVFRKY